jgi:hypothetical protein
VVNQYNTKSTSNFDVVLSQSHLRDSPAPYPVPARPTLAYNLASAEEKGSIRWCLEHFASDSFPQNGSVEIYGSTPA